MRRNIRVLIFYAFIFSARLPLSRAEERLRSLAPPFTRTAVRKHQAQKMIPTQLEDRGVFHIVSTFLSTETATMCVCFISVYLDTDCSQNDFLIHLFDRVVSVTRLM